MKCFIALLALLALLACAACKKTEALPETTTTTASARAPVSAAPPVVASASAAPAASAIPAPSLKTFPGTDAGAQALCAEFVKPGADIPGLSAQLRPATADYKVLFDAKTAAKLDAAYGPQWESGAFVVTPRQGQTKVLVDSATAAELKTATGAAKDFPSGYKLVASHLVGTTRVYRFRFVEPGKELGNSYDGLAHINGHWVLIPKPWRALDDRH